MNKINKESLFKIVIISLIILAVVMLHSKGSFAINLSPIDPNMDVGIGDNGMVNISGQEGGVDTAIKAFFGFIKLLSGGGTLVMLMVFIINFVKLGAAGTNANARAQAISALIWSGIATACLSMVTVIFFFFFRLKESVQTADANQSIEV